MPDELVRSRPGLRNFYSQSDPRLQDYFGELPELLDGGFSLDVSLAYVFARTELAHVNSLYCGLVKLHKVDSGLARRAVQRFHMTRDGFRTMFNAIYGTPIPNATVTLITVAEGVRDAVLHGKGGNDSQKRNAVAHVLKYAQEVNDHVVQVNGPRPFGDLSGFSGAASCLNKDTSRWVLKGIGFGF